jgi:hypothetical protein
VERTLLRPALDVAVALVLALTIDVLQAERPVAAKDDIISEHTPAAYSLTGRRRLRKMKLPKSGIFIRSAGKWARP